MQTTFSVYNIIFFNLSYLIYFIINQLATQQINLPIAIGTTNQPIN